MAFAEGITINPQAFTGTNNAQTIGTLSRVGDGKNNSSLWALSSSTSTLPIHFEVSHREIKKGKAVYVRSTIALIRKQMAAPVGDPESTGASGYSYEARLILTSPTINGVITDAAKMEDLGRLLSFFGVTLGASSVPSSALQKFFNRET